MIPVGAGFWRVHEADGSPVSGGSATPEVVGSRRTLPWAGHLLRPVRVLDDVHKVGPPEAGHEVRKDIRVGGAPRRPLFPHDRVLA
jgi:hypothetical protein